MLQMDIGRFLVVLGGVTFIVGLFFIVTSKFNMSRLPGDLVIGKGEVQFLIPVTTIILLSIAVTLVVNFLSK